MSRHIDADALIRYGKRGTLVYWEDIENAPSIDIVRCRECIYAEKASSPITALWCKRFGLKDMAVEADDFCSWGKREGE